MTRSRIEDQRLLEDLFDTRVPPGERDDPDYRNDEPSPFDEPDGDEKTEGERKETTR